MESKYLLRYINNTFDVDSNKRLFYQGLIAGSEFVTYNALKLYVAINVEFGTDAALGTALNNHVALYDDGNVLFFTLRNIALVGDVTDNFTFPNNVYSQDLYFSRIVVTGYEFMRFDGYRITLI
jgi:hypothetical protein